MFNSSFTFHIPKLIQEAVPKLSQELIPIPNQAQHLPSHQLILSDLQRIYFNIRNRLVVETSQFTLHALFLGNLP